MNLRSTGATPFAGHAAPPLPPAKAGTKGEGGKDGDPGASFGAMVSEQAKASEGNVDRRAGPPAAFGGNGAAGDTLALLPRAGFGANLGTSITQGITQDGLQGGFQDGPAPGGVGSRQGGLDDAAAKLIAEAAASAGPGAVSAFTANGDVSPAAASGHGDAKA